MQTTLRLQVLGTGMSQSTVFISIRALEAVPGSPWFSSCRQWGAQHGAYRDGSLGTDLWRGLKLG